jgi:hypothetical protein
MAHFQRTDGSGVLVLAPGDNVAVATTELPAGTQRTVNGLPLTLKAKVDVGHKFAARRIAKGERIVKCGAPIGSALRDIEPGECIHTHNVASDYIPTYTLEAGHRFVEAAK